MSLKRVSWLLGLLLLGACMAAPKIRHVADHDALWRIISQRCLVADAVLSDQDCAAVWRDPARQAVVLKDSRGKYQYLVLPIRQVSGIESPAAFGADAPDYFAAAWQARSFVAHALGQPLPREYTSLAINSRHGRSQDQLHIHVDCVRADVHAALQRMPLPGVDWRPLPTPLLGHVYQARFLPGEDLPSNPLHLLEAHVGNPAQMGDYSLVVLGARDATGQPGFLLLATRYEPVTGNFASGEELQDHACGVVTGATEVLEGVR